MEITSLNYEEQVIVRDLCKKQFQSLKRLYYKTTDKELLAWAKKHCIDNEVSEEQYKKSLIKRARLYQSIEKDPDRVKELNEGEMSMVKTVLFNFEEEYSIYYPGITQDLWQKFFLYDKLRKKENLD